MKFFVKVIFILLGIGVLFVMTAIIFLPDLDIMGSVITRNDAYGEEIEFSEETEFSNLTLDLKNRHVNVNFVDDDQFTMTYYKHENDTFDFELTDQTLVITHGFESFWGRFMWFNFVSKEYVTIELNIPNDWVLSDLDITIETGDMTIHSDEIKNFDDVVVKNGTGSVELSYLSLNNLTVDTATGDVILDNVSITNQTEIELSTGRIELNNVVTTDLNASSSTGDVDAKEVTADDARFVTSTGRATITDCVFETLYVRVSTGRIEVEHVVSNDYMLKTSTGDISVVLESHDDLKYDLSTSTGKVSIDGLKQGTAYQSLNGTIDFVAQTSTGNITVEVDA